MQSSLYRRYRFMKEHGRYVVGMCAAGALQRAKAEQWAIDSDVEFEWHYEECDYYDYRDMLGDHAYWCIQEERGEKHTHEVLWCAAMFNGKCIAALGGIIDPSTAYRRAIEAELALEAQQSIAGNVTYYY
mgnify:CR=1 FL=1